MSDKNVDEAKGRVKEAAGSLTDDDKLKREGSADRGIGQIVGDAQCAEPNRIESRTTGQPLVDDRYRQPGGERLARPRLKNGESCDERGICPPAGIEHLSCDAQLRARGKPQHLRASSGSGR